jgi:hypothetical protein
MERMLSNACARLALQGHNVKQISMTVIQTHVVMEQYVLMTLIITDVTVLMDSQALIVTQNWISAFHILARMVAFVLIILCHIPALATLGSLDSSAKLK